MTGLSKDFRYRGKEQTRVETISDAVFALAITLLLISSSASRSYAELVDFTNELIPFALCIAPIMLVWYEHFIFFYRYGFKNRAIVWLNALLLFVLLFYVYPLKFLAEMLYYIFGWMLTRSDYLALHFSQMMKGGNMAVIMIIYGCGAACIFFTFALMYRYALRRADELELDELERFHTRVSMQRNFVMGLIPTLSALLAVIFNGSDAFVGMISGFTYFLYMPVPAIFRRMAKRKRAELVARLGLPS